MVRIPACRETLPVVGPSVRRADESGQAQGGRYSLDPEPYIYINPAPAPQNPAAMGGAHQKKAAATVQPAAVAWIVT